jgi:hypothetical protein
MIINFKKLAALTACLCLPLGASAVTIFATSDALGRVQNGVAADAVSDANMVNTLVAMANGTSTAPYIDPTKIYTLISDPVPLLPLAVFVSTSAVGGDSSVDIGAGGYAYLTIKYDGANGSELVYFIQGLSGVISVPSSDLGNTKNQYSLFNSTQGGTGVPDGGATVLLLGAGLTLLAFARRFSR